ncbi:MAG: hypothetical protein JKY86_02205 [Gammaproteobacteria bacterium]|nr:hypothetical protein [Gammaproteobacteria bacterium]
MKHIVAFFIFTIFFVPLGNAETPYLSVKFQDSDLLKISYTFTAPTTRLAFKRNPDNSRSSRWNLVSEEFYFFSEDNIEYISRKDLSAFNHVEIEVPANYTYLPADYAPFQPFSDGGMLFHSGRFFACSEQCSDSDDVWRVTAFPSAGSSIIFNGEKYNSSISWEDKADGMNVYHGNSLVIETAHFIAVIDSGMPPPLKTSLEVAFPTFMEYFAEQIGTLDSKPMLFASYGKTGDGRFGRQGGALPNQVFMHWYGDNLEELLTEEGFLEDTNWFFAHEAAHIYQQRSLQTYSTDHPWIHEGFAEIFARQALLADSGTNREYVDLVASKATTECLSGLVNTSLSQAALNNSFELNYSCGFMLHSMVIQKLTAISSSSDIFDIWQLYHEAINSGVEPTENTYFGVVSSLTSESFVQELIEIIH